MDTLGAIFVAFIVGFISFLALSWLGLLLWFLWQLAFRRHSHIGRLFITSLAGITTLWFSLLTLAYFAGFEVGKGIVSLILALIFLAFFLSRLIKPRVVKAEESPPSASG